MKTVNQLQDAAEDVSRGVAVSGPKSMTQTQIGTIGEVTVAAQLMLE